MVVLLKYQFHSPFNPLNVMSHGPVSATGLPIAVAGVLGFDYKKAVLEVLVRCNVLQASQYTLSYSLHAIQTVSQLLWKLLKRNFLSKSLMSWFAPNSILRKWLMSIWQYQFQQIRHSKLSLGEWYHYSIISQLYFIDEITNILQSQYSG